MTTLKSPSFPAGIGSNRSEAEVRASRAARADIFVCDRCRVELQDADEAEGCEDPLCPNQGGVK